MSEFGLDLQDGTCQETQKHGWIQTYCDVVTCVCIFFFFKYRLNFKKIDLNSSL